MSTTTIGDLLDRAESLARSLRATRAETTTDQWRSFHPAPTGSRTNWSAPSASGRLAALRVWATRARTELAWTVPSTEVLRDIANQASHLYAVSAALAASFIAGHTSEHAARVVHVELRGAG